jgi:hypothetical protein
MGKKLPYFEDFLIDEHAKRYVGLDDDMPDACSDWISDLDSDDLMKSADAYGKKMYMMGAVNADKSHR